MKVKSNMYGAPLALPGEFLESKEPPAAEFLDNLRRPPSQLPTRPVTNQLSSSDPPKALAAASFVFVRRGAPGPPLSPLYDGPYKVLSSGPKFFTLQLGNRQEKITVDRLKPCLSQEVSPALPPQRGRPPRTAPT